MTEEVKTTRRPWFIVAVLSAAASPFWLFCLDMYPILVAASIPWSTTAVAVFTIIWFIILIPTIEPRAFLRCLQRPAYFLPIAFFALAGVGVLWAEGPWSVRLRGISPVMKLLVIPFLLYHFERSRRGHWVFVAFLASCGLLMGLSWIVLWDPGWKITDTEIVGVPLKNAIDQNQEFALCIFGLASIILTSLKQRRFAAAGAYAFFMLAFFCNMMFAVLARTALVYMLALTILFAVHHLKRTAMVSLLVGAAAAAVLIWFSSPYLRERVEHVAVEYREYNETNRPTSTGQRLAYWHMSIKSISEALLFGHGTGSAKQMFDREAVGKIGAWADSISNPHNQTLYVAIQWGALGCLILYAMWFSHLSLFRGADFSTWIGLIVVVQNIVSSVLNSHLFDFHEGWIYVLGVGVAGGMQQNARGTVAIAVIPICQPCRDSGSCRPAPSE
jgi:O-antigen ligase